MGTTAEDAMSTPPESLRHRLETERGLASVAKFDVLVNLLRDAEEAIAELEAQVAALTAQVPQWQPMETAPKDGSGVLFRTVGGRSLVLRWCPCDEYPDTWTDGEYHWSALKLTHWMPLPSPPRGEDGTPTPEFPVDWSPSPPPDDLKQAGEATSLEDYDEMLACIAALLSAHHLNGYTHAQMLRWKLRAITDALEA